MTFPFILRFRALLLFGVLLLAGVGVELCVVHRPNFTTHPLLPAAVSFDVLVLGPLLYYALVVRAYRLPLSTVAGAFAGAVALAYWMLPADQQQYVGWARQSLVAIEALVFSLALVNLRRVVRAFRASRPAAPGYVEALLAALRPVFGRLSAVVGLEVSVVYYALFSWQARPEQRPSDKAFTVHQESAFTAIMSTVALLSVAEMGAVHLLLVRWQPMVAGGALALHLYGLLVLLAHIRAVRLRPVLLTETGKLALRTGFLWRLMVPLADVERVEPLREAPPRAPGLLNLAGVLLTPPNLLLTLRQPQVAQGPYGLRRRVRSVAIYLDQPHDFCAAWLRLSSVPSGPVVPNKP